MSVMNDHEINNSGFSSLMIISGLRCPWCPATSRVPGEQAPRRRSPRLASICRWTASRFSLGAVWSDAEKWCSKMNLGNSQLRGAVRLWISMIFHQKLSLLLWFLVTSPGPKWSKMIQGYITGQILPVDGGEWFGKKPMMPRELVSRASEVSSPCQQWEWMYTSITIGFGGLCR